MQDQDSMEEEYQKLLYLMKCIEYMTDFRQKANLYKHTSAQFREILDYKDSEIYANLCIQLAKKSKKDFKKSTYKAATLKKNKANKADDYKAASDLFKQILGYRDADSMALECDNILRLMMNKEAKRQWIRRIIIALSIMTIIFIPRTAHAKYYMANAYMYIGSYPSAIEGYKKLGSYKDSKERLIESRYQKASMDADNKDYKAAAKGYAAIDDYKDSENQLVLAEKRIIRDGKLGDKIKIGKYDWIVLENNDNKAFLMKYTSINEMPYNSEAIDTTWEKSTLREWLNSEFFNNSFSDEEKNNILLTEVKNNENPIYNTPGGNDTSDYIYILSTQEVEDYSSLFPDFKTNTWLRSSGAYPNTAAFLSENGAIMEYGYIVNSNNLKIRPVMWYKLD